MPLRTEGDRRKLLIVTTVPETLSTILRHQPKFLSRYYDVSIATSPGKEFSMVEDLEGVPVYAIAMDRRINLLRDVISIVKMIFLIAKLRPDVVHSYTPKAGLVTMLAAWLSRVPVRVHTFTGLVFTTKTGIYQRVLILVDGIICFCATNVIPEGNGVRKDLIRYRVTRKPLHLIGFGNIAGVDIRYFSPKKEDVVVRAERLLEALSIPVKSFLFCYVGRLNREKGIYELARAFEALPKESHLLLVGAIDQSAPVDDATMAMLASNPRVHVLGFMDDVRPALECSDVFVLPSYREGFPNSLLQACSMAIPAIASNINGCNEIIEDKVTGWLVSPRSVCELQEAMAYAMSIGEDELHRMGLNARRRVSGRHERGAYLMRMVEFYESTKG